MKKVVLFLVGLCILVIAIYIFIDIQRQEKNILIENKMNENIFEVSALLDSSINTENADTLYIRELIESNIEFNSSYYEISQTGDLISIQFLAEQKSGLYDVSPDFGWYDYLISSPNHIFIDSIYSEPKIKIVKIYYCGTAVDLISDGQR